MESPALECLYLGSFRSINPIMSHRHSKTMAARHSRYGDFSLLLYLGLFVLQNPRALLHISGMVLLGILYMPINGGGCTFFIFAAAMLPFCVGSQPASAIGLVSIGTIGAIEGLLIRACPRGACFTLRFFL